MAPASRSSSTGSVGAPGLAEPDAAGGRRRNQGCQPIDAGIGSSAWISSRKLKASILQLEALDRTRPANGQSGPSSVAIVRSSRRCQGRSSTVPWMAWGGISIASCHRRPRNVNAPSRTRPANGAIGNEPQAIGPKSLGDQELAAIDHQRSQATPMNQVDDGLDPGRLEAQGVWVRAARPWRAGLLGEPDRQRSAAGRRDRRQRRPLGNQLLSRRLGPKDLLVESCDDPADRLPSRLSFPDHHLPAPADAIALERGEIVRHICGA